METRKLKDMLICVKDKDGIEGWISMAEFGKTLIETVGEAINETVIEISKSLSTMKPKKVSEHNNDFKVHKSSPKPCQECDGTGIIKGDYITAKCIKCGGTGKAS